MPPKKPTKRKAANGYNLPDPIPAGNILIAYILFLLCEVLHTERSKNI